MTKSAADARDATTGTSVLGAPARHAAGAGLRGAGGRALLAGGAAAPFPSVHRRGGGGRGRLRRAPVDDYVTSTHRGHGHLIAKGAGMERAFAEIAGRATGFCKGKGGTMHVADLSLGFLGAISIVAGGMPIAVGSGLSAQVRGYRSGHGLLLRGRSRQPRKLRGGAECRSDLEASRHLRLREQSVERVHADGESDGGALHRRPGRRLRHARPGRGRERRGGRLRRRSATRPGGRAPARGRRSSNA